MSNIETLKQAGIDIPKGAMSFHTATEGRTLFIIFIVHDFHERYFYGHWHTHEQALTERQETALRAANLLGTWGWELEVADTHGYQPFPQNEQT
ncbi:MAG: hypothetical protein LBV49_10875 [Azonexus sp.]|nr:hypothetical protein [Azonexus sp.]